MYFANVSVKFNTVLFYHLYDQLTFKSITKLTLDVLNLSKPSFQSNKSCDSTLHWYFWDPFSQKYPCFTFVTSTRRLCSGVCLFLCVSVCFSVFVITTEVMNWPSWIFLFGWENQIQKWFHFGKDLDHIHDTKYPKLKTVPFPMNLQCLLIYKFLNVVKIWSKTEVIIFWERSRLYFWYKKLLNFRKKNMKYALYECFLVSIRNTLFHNRNIEFHFHRKNKLYSGITLLKITICE